GDRAVAELVTDDAVIVAGPEEVALDGTPVSLRHRRIRGDQRGTRLGYGLVLFVVLVLCLFGGLRPRRLGLGCRRLGARRRGWMRGGGGSRCRRLFPGLGGG